MKTEFGTLISLLEDLRIDLQLSKNGASKYIESLIAELTTASTVKDQTQVLVRIKSGSKVVEYANFKANQEKLWLEIWEEATRLLDEQS